MAESLQRAGLGFAAAVIAVLAVHQTMWSLLHVLALPNLSMPPAWPLDPTPPLGVPKLVSLCFWGGLWGTAFGAVWRGSWRLGGVCLAVAATLTGYFIVGPLKGIPIENAYQLDNWARSFLINGPWGLATAFWLNRLTS